MFSFTDTYSVNFTGQQMFLEVWCGLISTAFRQVDALPADFYRRFTPAQEQAEWNGAIPP